jgi:hypothetical protein
MDDDPELRSKIQQALKRKSPKSDSDSDKSKSHSTRKKKASTKRKAISKEQKDKQLFQKFQAFIQHEASSDPESDNDEDDTSDPDTDYGFIQHRLTRHIATSRHNKHTAKKAQAIAKKKGKQLKNIKNLLNHLSPRASSSSATPDSSSASSAATPDDESSIYQTHPPSLSWADVVKNLHLPLASICNPG